jgi:hypothetical protein
MENINKNLKNFLGDKQVQHKWDKLEYSYAK